MAKCIFSHKNRLSCGLSVQTISELNTNVAHGNRIHCHHSAAKRRNEHFEFFFLLTEKCHLSILHCSKDENIRVYSNVFINASMIAHVHELRSVFSYFDV